MGCQAWRGIRAAPQMKSRIIVRIWTFTPKCWADRMRLPTAM